MSRRDPEVIVRFGIESAPRVEIVSDSEDDFRRLAFAIRSNEANHVLVSDAIELQQQSFAERGMTTAILEAFAELLREIA